MPSLSSLPRRPGCASNLIWGVILEGRLSMFQVCSEIPSLALLGPQQHFRPTTCYPAKSIKYIYLCNSTLCDHRGHISMRCFPPAPPSSLSCTWSEDSPPHREDWEEIKTAGLGGGVCDLLVCDMCSQKATWDLFYLGWSGTAALMRWCVSRHHGR